MRIRLDELTPPCAEDIAAFVLVLCAYAGAGMFVYRLLRKEPI